MLLHQRAVVERGAPRWWTLTAAASFLTLAACTAGIKLYADEPPKDAEIKLIVVSDDDGKDGDKKKAETKTVIVNGKHVQGGDGKTFTYTLSDDAAKPAAVHWQGVMSPDKQKAIDEAMKKLDKVLEKLPNQIDDSTLSQLKDLKKTLKALQETNVFQLKGSIEAAKDAAQKYRVRVLENLKDGDDLKKHTEEQLIELKLQAGAARDQAMRCTRSRPGRPSERAAA